jgi:FixJ family two-component response regulator
MPPEALIKLRRVATGLASQVQNDNVYSQDATQDYLRLRQRHKELTQAEADLVEIITAGADRQAARSLMIAWQMVAQERANIESQIADYDGRASQASFDLSLNGPGPMLMIE